MVTVSFVLTEPEFTRTWRGSLIRQPTFVFGVAFFVVLLVVGLVTVAAVAGVAAVGLVWAALYATFMPSVRWRRVSDLAANEFTYVFDDETFQSSGAGASSTVPWSAIRAAARVGAVYTLTAENGTMIFVPSRAFAAPADEQTYRELVTAHVSG